MNSIQIAIKNKTKLTQYLEKEYNIEYYKKPTLLSKLFSKNRKPLDIYIHQGVVNDATLQMVVDSSCTIVNSSGIKRNILNKLPSLDSGKIKVVFPYLNCTIEYSKNLKKEFKSKFMLDKDTRIIFFSGKDLNLSGIKAFQEVIEGMQQTNFVVMIESNAKEIEKIKLQINRLKVPYKILFFSDYKNIDELFIVSDIYVLPTKLKLFAPAILKAMFYKNAIFLMASNYAAEILDTFSLIQSDVDRAVPFKIDALLANKDELKKIQKENQSKSLKYGFNSRTDIVNIIIKRLQEEEVV